MTYSIRKRFTFSASHQLLGLPPEHQCSRLHGHNYVVQLELQSVTLDPRGFVVDYGDLAPFRRLIDSVLDHRHLNDALAGAVPNTTAEHLARWLYVQAVNLWPQTVAVQVEETPTSWAEYRP